MSIAERRQIFHEFWDLGNHDRQWDYLDKSITTIQHENSADTDKQYLRKIARQYLLTVQTRKIRVCQTMFLHTFGRYYLL